MATKPKRPTRPAKISKSVAGQPTPPPGGYVKTTLIIRPDQDLLLKRLSMAIRETTGATVHQTAVIRALLDAIAEAGIDLSACRSEADVKAALLKRLR